MIGSRVWSSAAAIRAREEVVFKFLRREFILDRSLDAPFSPKDPDKRVEDSFNFGRYLGLAQIHILSHAVEVQQKTWLFFAVMAIAFYFIAKLVHEKVMVSSLSSFGVLMYVICFFHPLTICASFVGFGMGMGWFGMGCLFGKLCLECPLAQAAQFVLAQP